MRFAKNDLCRQLCPLLLIFLIAAVAVPAHAQVPRLISYQGTLTEDGLTISDTLSITFSFHSARIGGAQLWVATRSLDITEGRFSVLLGSERALPKDLFAGAEALYLQVQIGDAEPLPRLRLASTAFALRAALAEDVANGAVTEMKLSDGAVTAPKLAENAVTGIKIMDGQVQRDDLANDAVGTEQLAEGAVEEPNIATGAVTSRQINNNTISGIDIDDDEVVKSIRAPDGSGGTITLQDEITLQEGENVDIEGQDDGTIVISVANGVFDDTQRSSRRWKENIEPLTDALDRVVRLEGVSFEWKKSGRTDIGLIAEEVAKIIPEVVAYQNGKALGLNYGHLVALLIEAIKTQQAQLDRRQTEVQHLNKRVARLERLLREHPQPEKVSPATIR